MDELKVLIADDNPDIRLILKKLIEKTSGFEVAAQAENGTEALQLYEKHRPEVVFLDVEMPGMSGIDVAREIMDMDPSVKIVFATAHEQYMREAFEVYAFDYLIKPFDMERLRETLSRMQQSAGTGIDENELSDLKSSLKKIMIRFREGISILDMSEIIFIQREDRNTVIYTHDDKITTSESLGDLQERLDGNLFFRSHKSYIININSISKIYPYGRWTYIVKLKGLKQDALITHDKFAELEKRLF